MSRAFALLILPALAAVGRAEDTPDTPPDARPPAVRAVVIGIDRYEDPEIPPSFGAIRDARAVRQWFVRAGWDSRDVLLLQDAGQAKPGPARDQVVDLRPTRANLRWALEEWVNARSRPGDVVAVYFAGQAVGLAPEPDARPGSPGRQYLLPIDARAADLDKTGWVLEDALAGLAAKGRHPVVCWLDTSLRGRGALGPAIPGSDPSASANRWLNELARWPGVTAWLAADGTPAIEAADLNARSAFTGALLESLGPPGKADNLLAALDRLRADPAARSQGFRTRGGIAPDLTLWSSAVRARLPIERTLLLQRGHADRIESLAFTADGDRLATASWDSTVKVWRVADRVLLRDLPGYFHLAGVSGLTLSPDGRWLASADGDGRVRAYDLIQHREKRLIGPQPHGKRVIDLRALPDGVHFLSADQDGKARLWDASGDVLSHRRIGDEAIALAVARQAGPAAFALAEPDRPIRLFGPDGAPVRALETTELDPFVTTLALSPDGSMVASGDERGRVVVRDAAEGREVARHDAGAEVALLALSATGSLLVGTASTLALIDPEGQAPARLLEVAEPVARAAFSADGLWLAASTRRTGTLQVWRLDEPGGPRPIALAGVGPDAPATLSFAFGPDGRSIASGDQDGGVRWWDLPAGTPSPAIRPHRGKVASISASADGRHLLQITRDWTALHWDLQDGRGFAPIEGAWTAGALTPDGETLALTSYAGGEVVLVDRQTGRPRRPALPRPGARTGPGAATWRFGPVNVAGGDRMLIASPDGRWLAACSPEGPLACVWEVATGRLAFTIGDPDHRAPIVALDVSADGRRLLTADLGGRARTWDLERTGEGASPRPIATFEAPGAALSAARIAPGEDAGSIALGTRDGRVLLWAKGAGQAALLTKVDGAIQTLAFTPDGRTLLAGGADKSVRALVVDQPGRSDRPDLKGPHAERVNTILTWPGTDGRVAVSGSDDTTIRFWDLREGVPLGTLSAVQSTTGPVGAADEGGVLDSSWVAYTPDGLFDSSPGGEAQVTWLGGDGDEVVPLEQFFATGRVFGLCDQLRQGKKPAPPDPPREPEPRLAIDPITPSKLGPEDREVELSISLSAPDLQEVRLYQNGVPIRGEPDLSRGPGDVRLTTRVALRSGTNRFYAMASRPGAIDGRSNVVEVDFDGPDDPGRLHILALGVSKYEARALQFAHIDARQIAGFLQQNGIQGADGLGDRIVLTDAEVTTANVERAMLAMQRKLEARPQDTVVVFLAGHTDVLDGRFCLLLPDYPLAPEPATASPGQVLVASRGPDPANALRPPPGERIDPKMVLQYSTIYRSLSRFDALQRLVIVDACQAEAVLDDPGVRLIRKVVDDGAHAARTTYILAARRGEPAAEVAALRHGLLSYVLLKGMGDPDLEPVPEVDVFDALPNADLDGNGLVGTGELRRFADRTLPILAARFPVSIPRAGGGPPIMPTANLEQTPRVQETGSRSFPLVRLPGKAPGH